MNAITLSLDQGVKVESNKVINEHIMGSYMWKTVVVWLGLAESDLIGHSLIRIWSVFIHSPRIASNC